MKPLAKTNGGIAVLEGLFGKRKKGTAEPVTLPEALMPEDPVNYNSVLNYLVGLSNPDYTKMTKSAEIYREADAKVAKVIGVKNEPTTAIKNDTPPMGDDELDSLLNADPDALASAFIDDAPKAPAPKKKQAAERKIEVKE